MPLSKPFRETVVERATADPEFRAGLLGEAAECYLAGELGPAKSLLRDYVNATIGFRGLGDATGLPEKSLMRMLGESGNPTAANLAAILAALQQHEGISFQVEACR